MNPIEAMIAHPPRRSRLDNVPVANHPSAKSIRTRRWFAAALCAACVTPVAGGCRSGSGMNLFARRGPSAEALAGTGPTTTYPVPPSASATPTAIASIAGGTATRPPTTNYAAATANGFPGKQGAGIGSAVSQTSGSAVSGIDTGIRTASNATGQSFPTPSYGGVVAGNPSGSAGAKSPAVPSGMSGSAASSITPPSGYALTPPTSKSRNNVQPPASFNGLAGGTSAGTSPSPLTGTSPSPSTGSPAAPPVGFALPDDLPGLSSPTASTPPAGQVATQAASQATTQVAAKTASLAGSAASSVAPPATADTSIAPVGYTPGSIRAVTGGYPGATPTKPRSSGSFYR